MIFGIEYNPLSYQDQKTDVRPGMGESDIDQDARESAGVTVPHREIRYTVNFIADVLLKCPQPIGNRAEKRLNDDPEPLRRPVQGVRNLRKGDQWMARGRFDKLLPLSILQPLVR